MATIEAVIRKLERVRSGITQPQIFYREQQRDWTQLARRSVEAVLAAMQPANVEPSEWLAKITEISARIVVEFYDDETESGLLFAIAPRPGTEEPDTAAGFTLDNISIDDIERWVRAGEQKTSPEEPGKDLGPIDVGKTPKQIAWRVMYALKLRKRNWQGLMTVLREYIGLETEEAATAIYAELLKRWFEFFSVRAPAQWREFVRGPINNAPF